MPLRIPESRPAGGLVSVLPASLHLPPLTRSVGELATADHRLRTVLGVTNTVVDEPEALAGCDVEGFGVVGHGGDPNGRKCRGREQAAETRSTGPVWPGYRAWSGYRTPRNLTVWLMNGRKQCKRESELLAS